MTASATRPGVPAYLVEAFGEAFALTGAEIIERLRRPGIYVLCNRAVFDARKPEEASRPIPSYGTSVEYVARYPGPGSLPGGEVCARRHAWWREISRANIEVEWRREEVARDGIWGYIEEAYGASSERNRAAVFGELAAELAVDPITLADWCATHDPRAAGARPRPAG